MSGICFNPDGVSLDTYFKTTEFEQVLNLLDKHKDDIDINIYNKIKEVYDKAKEQNGRNIHKVVSERVEYDYDIW